uniref:Mannosyl-glycoprotein endo-beta-N-acetylglucosaminidase n=1 Tax=Macrostomum lignano TaxID=282301 RepID=A0A1I8FLL4_9PLAT
SDAVPSAGALAADSLPLDFADGHCSGSSLDAYSSDSSEEEILRSGGLRCTCCSQSRGGYTGCMAAGSDRPSAFGAGAPREDLPTSSPRVLVCHDMQGGYLDDAYLYGNANASAFRLFHWHLIDSDDTPAGWVDLCHRHGVPCLGTFIAEWDSGLEAMRQLLSNEKDAIGWADRLIDLADAGGFDGWLINVEVALPAELVPALQAFVRRLKSKSSLHIVWYDSVITDGQLLWQNSVNALKRRLPDSGRLNPVELLLDCRLVEVYSRQAGRASVVVLFGSNRLCRRRLLRPWLPGGGGFNCSEAVRMIVENQQLGVGLFAPGWAYETCRSALNQTKPMETPRTFGRVWWTGLWSSGRHDSTAGEPGPWLDDGGIAAAWCHKRLEQLVGGAPDAATIGCAVLSSTCRCVVAVSRLAGGGCLRVALSGGVGGGIGGNGGCELPLFRLSLPARQVRALKLVYSLDSVFEDRPLDPVTVCLVAKYRRHSSSVDSIGGRAQRQQQQQLIVLCHSSESRLSCSEMATVQSHYSVGSGGGSSQTLVFPRTVRRERGRRAAGHGGVVWHMVYTEAADAPLWSIAITKTPAMLTKTCVLEQLCLFFILPSRLESTEPVCVFTWAR